MTRYVAFRIVNIIPTIVLISMFVFLITYLLPGDPALIIGGTEATPEQVAAIRQQWGLNEPIYVRYGKWAWNVAQGNLGVSYYSRKTVGELMGYAMPITAELAVLALLVAVIIAVPTGIISAVKRGSAFDFLATAGGFVGLSVPGFWLGIMLIYLFAVNLKVLPAGGFVPLTQDVAANLKGMIMPAIALGTFSSTQLMRYLRASMLEVLHADYVRTARAKGLAERAVLFGHAVRNALIPFLTVLGMQMGYLLGGTVITEQVFALPGIGRLVLGSVLNRDYQVAVGIVLVIALTFVTINLVVDLLYSVLDPRVRLGKSGAGS